MSNPKVAEDLANVFLSRCLVDYSFSRVAFVNEKVVGIILVKDMTKHQYHLLQIPKQIKSILVLYLSKEGRKITKMFRMINEIDQELLNKRHKSYPAELSLFAVDSSCRGKGIGKQLFQVALDYIHQQQIHEFYLFTDTSCNYGFYEHQGMKRCLEKEHQFYIKEKAVKIKFFIYEYLCHNK